MPSFSVSKLLVGPAVAVGVVLSLPSLAGASESYTVEEGETLSHVALRTHLSVGELQLLNGLDDADVIYAGQTIVIAESAITHTVVAGETLSELAVRYGTTSTELMRLNDLANKDRIRVGSELIVPSTPAAIALSSVEAGTYPGLPQRILDRPERLALLPVFEKWAAANDLPVDLLMATAWHESGWNQDAESYAGAVGVGQLMPVTADWVAASLIGEPELDRFVVEDNIRMSARYLDWLLDRNDGDVRLALGGYFQGPTSVARGEWLDATETYVANVEAQRSLFVSLHD